MADYLDTLALDTKKTIAEGYYKSLIQISGASVSLRKAIIENKKNPIITEIKASSPSRGIIKSNFDPTEIAKVMEKSGATGISVLTEPKHFGGSLSYFAKIREAVKLPMLMKDIIIDNEQLEAASIIGANVILLIQALFNRGYCKLDLDEMIKEAHSKSLEVLLETHTQKEFRHAIETDADLIGINNRDLRTFEVDLHVTEKILKNYKDENKIIVSESGITTPDDLLFLQDCGAQAFLIGSSVMMADNIGQKVKEFVFAQ